MAFESRKVYRALNGAEIKTIISQRVLAAMMEDNALNMARSFPLLQYEVTVKLTPYHQAGPNDVKPDPDITYQVDGAVFSPVEAEPSVVLVEKSPIYGKEADPQELRKLAEQGTVETTRTNTGELVDVRSKPGSKTEPAVEPPPVQIVEPQSWADGKAPAAGSLLETAEETAEIEAARWRGAAGGTEPNDPIVRNRRHANPDEAGGD